MEKLRLNKDEKELILKDVRDQLNTCARLKELQFSYDKFNKNLAEKTKKPTIKIPADIWFKMQSLVALSDTEISWHGMIDRDIRTQTFTIYKILIFPQINTAASTTTEQDEYSKWMTTLLSDPDFKIEDLRMHGHSHVNMAVYSSGVDDQYQKDLLAQIEDGDYYLFLILNKKHEMCVLLYDYRTHILYTKEDLVITITDSNDKDIAESCKKEIASKCKSPKPVQPNYLNSGYYRRNFLKGERYGLK